MKHFYALLFTLFICSISYSQLGAALDFDGVNDYVVLDTPPSISGSFTVEAWVNPTNTYKTMHIVSTRDAGEYSFDIQLKAGNTIHADIGNGSSWLTTAADASYNYTAGTWFHLAYVVTPIGYTIYANGNPIGTGTFSGTPLLMNGTHKLALGKNASEPTLYEGKIDEVRIWNRALQKCEILNNLNNELASGQTGLSVYYTFNQGFAASNNSGVTILTDSSGNNYNASLENFSLGTGAFGSGSSTSNWVSSGGVASGNTTPAYVPLVVSSPQNLPLGATVANLTATGTAIKWYSAATAGTPLATTAILATATYYVTQTKASCESDRTPVSVIIPPVITPVITTFSPISGVVGATVTLTGINFNTTTANNSVFFGATKATVTAATATSLTVTVPSGATYSPIAVLNTGTALACYSVSNFTPVYTPSKTGITVSDFSVKTDFTTSYHPNSVAIGDLDGDGKPDLVVANSEGNTISIFRNTTTSGSVSSGSFDTKVDFATASYPLSIRIGDLNGDGKPELVVTNQESNTVSVFRNTTTTGAITTSSFDAKVDFATGSGLAFAAIGDLDGDGKPEIVVANNLSNSISVFRNTTTSNAAITTASFASKVDFPVASFPYTVAIADLDGDGKADIAVSGVDSVSVLRNTPTIGTITANSFEPRVDYFDSNLQSQSIAIGDLDADGKSDIVATSLYGNVFVYRNTATAGTITASSFAPKVTFATTYNTWSVAIGDLDADGKPDLALANADGFVSVLRNTTTTGDITSSSFASKVDFAIGINAHSVAIADLDADGKPDLAAVSASKNTVSVFRNTSNNNNLSGLTTSAGTLNPNFDATTTAYTINVSNATSTITVTPTKADANANILVNGAAVNSGTASGAINLSVGSNTITIAITAQNAITKWHTLTIKRAALLNNIGLTNTTPAATAYSLRKLSSTYTGKAIQVRRSSDNTVQDIGFDANGGLDTATLTTFVGSSSGYVAKWYDQSVNGNEATQTNTALQPRIVNAGVIDKLNNRPALYFGTANLATAKTTIFDTATSMVGFAKGNSSTPSSLVTKTGTSADANTNYPAPFDFSNSAGEFYVGNASAIAGSNNNIANSTPRSDVSLSVPASVYSFVIPASGTFYSYLNGIQSSSSTVVAYADNGNALQIGNRNDGNGSGNFWTTELVLFNSVLSTIDRQAVETSQKNYYNNGNANLSNLTSSIGSLSPVFSDATTSYTIAVTGATSILTLTPTKADANATITVNGTAVASGSASTAINLTVGSNTITVVVTAQDGTTKTYTITVPKPFPPVVTSFSPISGVVGSTVTLAGTDFNTTAANNIVFFGATKAVVTTATATSLTVTVPAGATYSPITVLNTGTVLACYSLSSFDPVYSPAKNAITATDLVPKVDFGAGAQPMSVAVGDLDGDGKPDLAVTNYLGNSVSVFRNTATSGSLASGNFATRVDFSTGSNPRSVAIADLDGDGKLDLAVTNYSANTISVLRNTATSGTISGSSFATKVDFVAATNPISIAIADLDGDGKPDLAVANIGADSVSVFRNTATTGINASSFAAKVDFATGSNPIALAIGDLDSDGKLDLVVSNSASYTLSVLRNTATVSTITTASFASKVDFATASFPRNVAIGDLDGDGKPDLAVTGLNSNVVSVYRNTAISGTISTSSFVSKVDFATGSSPFSVVIGDLDGDGKPDLAVANYGSNTVSVFRNSATSGTIATSSFASKIDFATTTQPTSIAITDLDLDGRPDLAATNYDGTVSIFRNANTNANLSALTTTAGTISPAFATATTAYSAAAVSATTTTTTVTPTLEDALATVQVQVNGGSFTAVTSGTASSALALNEGNNTITIKVTAQNGDVKNYTLAVTRAFFPPVITSFSPISGVVGTAVTILGTNFNATAANNMVFFGATRAVVTAATTTSLTVTVPAGATYAPITLLNTEKALACYGLNNFNPIYSPAKSTITTTDFAPKVDFTATSGSISVAIGDLDGDGKPDLATANYGSNTVSVYRNTATSGTVGAGSFAAKIDFATGTNPYSVAIGDLDGDGKLDLTVANFNGNTVSVLRNTASSGTISTSSFDAKVDFATGTYPRSVAIGDLDGDGKPDLATANYSGSVSILRNIATSGSIVSGSFAPKVDIIAVSSLNSLAIGDLDGDGKPDLAVTSLSSNVVSVFRNTATLGSITTASFATKVDFATTSASISVAIGDLNGDGKLDLATVNYNNPTVSVFRNTATSGTINSSSFATKVDFATAAYPQSVVIGDFDGDGKPDLAVANGSDTVSIFRNTVSGVVIAADSFASKVDFATGTNPRSVAIGDLDGDGKPDLAVATSGSSTLSIFRNTNNNANLSALTTIAGAINPVFATATTAYNATTAVSATTAITTVTPTLEDTSATVQVQINGGGFTAVTNGSSSGALALNEGNNTITIKVTAQNGDIKNYTLTVTRASMPPLITSFTPISGVVGTEVTILGSNFNATAVNNMVFFGATKAVVTAATATSLTVTVPAGATYAPITVLNTGTALACYSLNHFNPIYSPAKSAITATDFTAKTDFATGTNPYSVAVGDLDGDGKPDLAVANFSNNTVSVYRNTATSGVVGAGSFATKIDFVTGSKPFSVAIADVDGDGKLDLAVANYISSTVSVFRNKATTGAITAASFAAKVDFTTGTRPQIVAVADLDGDGKLDLATANYDGTVSLFRNTATSGSIVSGSFDAKVDINIGSSCGSIAIGDLDGDGKPDLVTGNANNNIYVLRNTTTMGSITTAGFATKVNYATTSISYSVAIGDLDGDGKLDLATANYNNVGVSVFRNTTTTGATNASFASRVDFSTSLNPQSIAIGDLDGDGKPDLAVASGGSNSLTLLRNTATSGTITTDSFAPRVDLTTGFFPISAVIADLDGDGKPDLTVANGNGSTLSIFRNTNNNTNLSALSLAGSTLSPTFATATTAYTAAVSNATTTTTIIPTLEDITATVQVQLNGGGFTTVTNGSASNALALNLGNNTIEIKVTAKNGDTKSYTVTVVNLNPLDNIGLTSVTPAKTAYSLRKLSSTYNGKAIQVRRASDDSVLDIGFDTNGGLDTTALTTFVGTSSGYVAKWYDQSGYGNEVTQTDTNLQPRIVDEGVVDRLNNKPALYFGNASLATIKTTLFANATSMVGFAKGNSTTSSALVTKTGTDTDANTNFPGPFDFTNSDGNFTVGNAAITAAVGRNLSDAVPRADVSITVPASVYSFVIPASGTFYSYLNGIQTRDESVAAYADNGNAMQIGNRNDGSSVANFWTTELVLFDSVLSTAERQAVETSQTNYYNNSNANLSALTTTAGAISPVFATATTAYTATVPNATSTITVTPTVENASATIEIQANGGGFTTLTSGSTSTALALTDGSNIIEVKVTAQNGSVKTYIITVCRGVIPTFTAIAPICSGSTFVLPTMSNNGITGVWSPAINTTATTTYRFTPNANQCAELTTMTVTLGTTTTWTVTNSIGSWSNGIPTSTSKAIINGNYSEAVNLEACSLDVTGAAVVTVPTGFNFTVSGKVTVASTASLTFENNSNLVQIEDVPNNGKIISKRNSNALMLLDYTLWSSPVAGQELQGFSPATLATRFYTYNPATDKYNATTPTANFATGTGYLIRIPNNHPTTPTIWNGSFTGIPNNGTVSLAVTNNTYNATGNPYPSTISADAFIDANALTEALYFWRKTNGTTASYATYTKAGGTANAGGLSSIVPNGTIQVGQGFLAKSTSTALIFTNAMRTANNANQFLKTKAIEKNRIWLNLAKDAAPANQMMVAYMTGATAGIDPAIDGRSINDSPIALNSIINNEEFVIQAKGLPFEDADVVPLTFKTNAAGNYTISIDHVDGLFSGNQDVFLNDKTTGTSQDLKKGTYTFTATTGTFNNRFELVYKSSTALGLDEQELSNSVLVFKQNGLVHINAGKTIMKTVRVYDLNGRLIFKQEKVNQNTTILKGFTAAEQTILVQITSDEDKIVTKKVMY
ncbi:FG-GAP-like repeat-containing protein [Flavobacterium restrictum]|uniref:T9SS type A sorting domain-containing protein n=1 Tax=Flavobacterium restrictum TaxID=2594428 RepID=A0A553DYB0_9FLAO|nr:FG-GAP-like repeat-containing protein [Flavobacterium restrictum]TRX37771.1 hypothetical protein FNW21_11800 [Flavobacterium restrictum]